MENRRNFIYGIIYLMCYGTVVLCIEENVEFVSLANYRLRTTGLILNINMAQNKDWSPVKCMVTCLGTEDCQSVSIKKDNSKCQLYSVSIAAIGSIPVEDNEWNTYVRKGWYPIVKHSAGESTYNGLSIAEFYSTENYNASFPDDNCGIDPAMKCNRPYKHTLKDYLLENELVTQMKISVYEAGSEAAYAVFTKESGLQDNWLKSSRLVESHPWDINLLQENTALYSFDYSSDISWLISEGSKYNTANVGRFTAHANWLHMKSSTYCDSDVHPVILYSKQGGPVHLATRALAYAVKSMQYDVSGHEAPSVCSNYLHTTIASKQQGDTAHSNGFVCCACSWVSYSGSYRSGLWLNAPANGCGSSSGFNTCSTSLGSNAGVLCVVDQALVGVADTLVVSVKLG